MELSQKIGDHHDVPPPVHHGQTMIFYSCMYYFLLHHHDHLRDHDHHHDHLKELLPKIGVEPAIENRVAHAGAEGDTVAQAKDEVIHLRREMVRMMIIMVMMATTLMFWAGSQRPRSVTVKKRWRGRKETAKVTAMQESTKVILLFLFLSRSCRLAKKNN